MFHSLPSIFHCIAAPFDDLCHHFNIYYIYWTFTFNNRLQCGISGIAKKKIFHLLLRLQNCKNLEKHTKLSKMHREWKFMLVLTTSSVKKISLEIEQKIFSSNICMLKFIRWIEKCCENELKKFELFLFCFEGCTSMHAWFQTAINVRKLNKKIVTANKNKFSFWSHLKMEIRSHLLAYSAYSCVHGGKMKGKFTIFDNNLS